MRNLRLFVYLLIGTTLLGLQFMGTSSNLPGVTITQSDTVTIVSGSYGPCKNNGQCQGNRPGSIVCVSDSGTQGVCSLSSGGDYCGSCTGTIENKTCAGTDTESSCSTTVVSGCCNVSSSCTSRAPDATSLTGSCDCLQGNGGGSIGSHVQCAS